MTSLGRAATCILFETLRVNLERWRWMPEDLGRRRILVNIPDFSVVVREGGRLNYRRDLYSRDAAVLAALRSPAPGV